MTVVIDRGAVLRRRRLNRVPLRGGRVGFEVGTGLIDAIGVRLIEPPAVLAQIPEGHRRVGGHGGLRPLMLPIHDERCGAGGPRVERSHDTDPACRMVAGQFEGQKAKAWAGCG